MKFFQHVLLFPVVLFPYCGCAIKEVANVRRNLRICIGSCEGQREFANLEILDESEWNVGIANLVHVDEIVRFKRYSQHVFFGIQG